MPSEYISDPGLLAQLNQMGDVTGPAPLKAAPTTTPTYIQKLAFVESNNDPNAKAKTSSATGRYQMTKGTFEDLRKKDPFLQSVSWEQHARDPVVQNMFANALIEHNDRMLKAHGHEANDLNRYLYHFAGAGGANQLLRANPSLMAAQILGPAFAKANPKLANLTASQLKAFFAHRLNSAPAVQVASAPQYDAGGYVKDPALLAQLNTPTESSVVVAPQEAAPVAPAVTPEPISKPASPSTWKQDVERVGRGVLQGAVYDPAAAVAQLLPKKWGTRDWAAKNLADYEAKRKELGGEGFDFARLGGNVVGSALPAGLVGKGAQVVGLGSKVAGLGNVSKGALAGAGGALLSPLEQQQVDEGLWGNKAAQLGMGVGLGGVLGKVLGPSDKLRLAQGLPVKAPRADLAQYRETFGNRFLTPGQQSSWGNPLEQKATSIPFVGELIKNRRMQAHKDFNLGMIDKALEPLGQKLPAGTVAGHDALEKAYGILGKQYDEVLKDTKLTDPQALRAKIDGTMKYTNPSQVPATPGQLATQTADEYLPGVNTALFNDASEAVQKRYSKMLENKLFSKFGKDPQGNFSMPLSGQRFKGLEEDMRSEISELMRGGYDDRYVGRMLKNALDEARTSLQSSDPKVTQRLKDINRSYAGYKILENAATRSGASEGLFTPTQVVNAAKRGNQGQGARGTALLQKEAELGQRVLGHHYPDSGTAGRMAALSTAGLAGGLGFLTGHLPAILAGTALYTKPGQATIGGLRKVAQLPEETALGRYVARRAPTYTMDAVRGILGPSAPVEEVPERAHGGLIHAAHNRLKHSWE